jgi:hypothetical protein
VRVPWALLVALGAAVFMVALAASWNLAGPTRFELAPAAQPTEATEFVPLAECDRMGCAPVVVLTTPRG